MTSPIIDERMLLKVLDCTAKYENVERLQHGAIMALLDAYDRKVTRDEFIPILQSAAAMIDAIGRLALLHNVEEFAKRYEGRATVFDIQRAMNGVQDMVSDTTKTITEIVERLKQCPLDEDRVH